MLNDILSLIAKLLNSSAGPQIKETLTAVAAGGELPYGTAIAELLKQQNLLEGADLQKVLNLVLALLGVESGEKDKTPAKCATCPYACGQLPETKAALPEKTPLAFDLDRAPSGLPLMLAAPDAAAAAEDALQARIRALS